MWPDFPSIARIIRKSARAAYYPFMAVLRLRGSPRMAFAPEVVRAVAAAGSADPAARETPSRGDRPEGGTMAKRNRLRPSYDSAEKLLRLLVIATDLAIQLLDAISRVH